jgi:hypothetical protein
MDFLLENQAESDKIRKNLANQLSNIRIKENKTMPSNDMRKSIAASILASIVVLFLIQPVVKIFWSYFSGTTSIFLRNIVDAVYKNAAFGQRQWVVVLVFLFILLSSVLINWGLTFSALFLKSNHSDINKNKHSWIRNKIKRMFLAKGYGIFMVVFGILCTLGVFWVFMLAYTDLQLNTSFEQRLTVLSPVIDDSQIKELRSSWASMKCRKDYRLIVDKMETIAKGKNVTLPPLLLN